MACKFGGNGDWNVLVSSSDILIDEQSVHHLSIVLLVDTREHTSTTQKIKNLKTRFTFVV